MVCTFCVVVFNSFPWSSVDKATAGTWSFVSITAYVILWLAAALDVTQFSDQLINSTSRVLQKLLKYFNGTIYLTFLVPSFPAEPVIFV